MVYKTIIILLAIPRILFSQQIHINEILSSNDSVYSDVDSAYSDWVELYNSGTSDVNLNGYYLSDDNSNVYKWMLPDTIIPANSYLLICASKKDTVYPNGEIHTNFKLSSAGEHLSLLSADSVLVDSISIPMLFSDQSYGRQPDDSSSWFTFGTPTLGQTNNNAIITLTSPVFSSSAGFYTDSFLLSFQSLNIEDTILYTLDGSEPDINNIGGKSYTTKYDYTAVDTVNLSYQTYMYTGPFMIKDRSADTNKLCKIKPAYAWWSPPSSNITKSTVVRANAYKHNAQNSKTVTNTFFVGTSGVNIYSMPVISISTTEDNLFDYYSGIHVPGELFYDHFPLGGYWPKIEANYTQRGRYWERPAHIEYFVNGNKEINQNIGVRIAGNVSRGWGRKTLRLYARSDYDHENEFSYPVFANHTKRGNPSEQLSSFKRLTIRNGGTNWAAQLFLDAFAQSAIKHLNMDILAFSPSIVFLNGEYWGCMNLRERLDKHYLEDHYDLDEGDVAIIKANSGELTHGIASDSVDYIAMRNFIHYEDMTIPANIDSAMHLMDVENFAKLFMLQIYINNSDWLSNNRKCWRKRTAYNPNVPYGQDGRFRWFVFDLDHGFKLEHQDRLDMVMSDNGAKTRIFRGLMENAEFRKYWINLLADNMNTSFLTDRIITELHALNTIYQPEIQEHKSRWGQMWANNSTLTMETFAIERPYYMKQFVINQFLEVIDTAYVTVDVLNGVGGTVKINTIDIDENTIGIVGQPYPWTGNYFTGVPVNLVAKAKPGYAFVEWLGTGFTNDSIEVDFIGDTLLTAVFVALGDTVEGIYINEVLSKNDYTIVDNYGEYDDFIELYNGSNDTIDISGLYLTDKREDKKKWKIPVGINDLAPGDYMIFWADKDTAQGLNHTNFKLSEETVCLYQVFGSDTILLDELLSPASNLPDITRGRLPDGDSTLVLFDFPTPDTTNTYIDDSIFSSIYINEFMPNNVSVITDGVGDYEDWIELYNAGNTPVNVGGLYLTDDLAEPNQYRIPSINPDSTTIPAGGFLLLWADKDTEQGILHLDFKLNNISEQIGVIRYSAIDTFFIDSLSYTFISPDVSLSRYPDGMSNWDSIVFTPNGSNVITSNWNVYEEECCKVYPNPSSGQLVIEGTDMNSISIHNIEGQVIFYAEELDNKHTINLRDYPSGIYILDIQYNESRYTGKLILE
jgi:hypothetical protein